MIGYIKTLTFLTTLILWGWIAIPAFAATPQDVRTVLTNYSLSTPASLDSDDNQKLNALDVAFIFISLSQPTSTPTTGPVSGCGVINFAWTKTNVLARGGQPTTAQIACLKQNGFSVFVRQNAATETTTSESQEQAAVVAAPAASYTGAFKIPDDTTYAPAMLEAMMDYVVSQLNQGKRVLVHDTAGRGRMGMWDTTFLLWDGYGSGSKTIEDRYLGKALPFQGAKIGCGDGGKGQVQSLADISQDLTGSAYFPQVDEYGTSWTNCAKPSYMNGWNYSTVSWPAH